MKDVTALASIPSALQSATRSINRALRNQDKDEAIVAGSTDVTSRDTIGAMIDSRQQLLYTQVAAKIVKANDEMTQSILDITA